MKPFLAGLLLVSAQALAQPYPAKPVRMVVPASPGGASDLIARMLAAPLAETLGQPFIVENRVTSGGIVGTQQVAESAPDGHTLLVTFDTFAINPFVFKNLKWDPVRDFTPVMQICRYPQVLLVNPGLGVRTLQDFVALAKQKGAQFNYGTAGPASSSRLAYEMFKDAAGIETVPVHYKGAAPAIQDLLSGQVQVMLVQGGGSIIQHVKTGKLVALAISSLERSKFYPELPLIADTYPGFETESWVAMFAPAATPKSAVDKLHGTLARLLGDPSVKERFEAQGCDLVAGTPDQLGQRVRSDQAKWGKIVREKNISIE
ncbi:MAG: Bug family tripartite tricarboxylate transporter substrate binding protein [Burkholderiales bacterium]